LNEHKTISGKVAIIAMIVVSLALTAFAWWYRYQQGRRAMEFWGPETAQLIRHAPRVELADLAEVPPLDLPRMIEAGDPSRFSGQNISDAPGLVHARHSLIVDSNFQWGERVESPDAIAWDVAWRFGDGKNERVVFLDYETGATRRLDDQRIEILQPAIVSGMRDYISRQASVTHSP
jgi:hypothetical protein